MIGRPIGRIYAWFARTVFETLPRFFGWFTKNPVTAIKIGAGSLLLAFSSDDEQMRNNLQAWKTDYPGALKQWSVSTAIGVAMVIFAGVLLLFFI